MRGWCISGEGERKKGGSAGKAGGGDEEEEEVGAVAAWMVEGVDVYAVADVSFAPAEGGERSGGCGGGGCAKSLGGCWVGNPGVGMLHVESISPPGCPSCHKDAAAVAAPRPRAAWDPPPLPLPPRRWAGGLKGVSPGRR